MNYTTPSRRQLRKKAAEVVFKAYVGQGYYYPNQRKKAGKAYEAERQALRATVLVQTKGREVVGTIMCAEDNFDLPVDRTVFADHMAEIRAELGSVRLGYFGKFGSTPGLEDQAIGRNLLIRAVTEWALARRVAAVVMIVNPKHVSCYARLGAQVVASTAGTPGLEKAPAVLLVLRFAESPQIVRVQNAYRHKCALGEV